MRTKLTGRFQRKPHHKAHKKHQTLREFMQWAMAPYKREIKCSSVDFWKFERHIARETRNKQRRSAIGMLRCHSPRGLRAHIFHGAYVGAEND